MICGRSLPIGLAALRTRRIPVDIGMVAVLVLVRSWPAVDRSALIGPVVRRDIDRLQCPEVGADRPGRGWVLEPRTTHRTLDDVTGLRDSIRSGGFRDLHGSLQMHDGSARTAGQDRPPFDSALSGVDGACEAKLVAPRFLKRAEHDRAVGWRSYRLGSSCVKMTSSSLSFSSR